MESPATENGYFLREREVGREGRCVCACVCVCVCVCVCASVGSLVAESKGWWFKANQW